MRFSQDGPSPLPELEGDYAGYSQIGNACNCRAIAWKNSWFFWKAATAARQTTLEVGQRTAPRSTDADVSRRDKHFKRAEKFPPGLGPIERQDDVNPCSSAARARFRHCCNRCTGQEDILIPLCRSRQDRGVRDRKHLIGFPQHAGAARNLSVIHVHELLKRTRNRKWTRSAIRNCVLKTRGRAHRRAT